MHRVLGFAVRAALKEASKSQISGRATRLPVRLSCVRLMSDKPPTDDRVDGTEQTEPWIPEFVAKFDEPIGDKRSRLMYQSRKRGMLENGLLLGNFAKKFLPIMDEEKLALYDRLINLPSNDWEIYYWATGVKETPEEFDNEVMNMLKDFVKNEHREQRITLPDL